MIKGYQYRLYPTEEQKILMEKHFGCARLVYNVGLTFRQYAWAGGVSVGYMDTQRELVGLKKDNPFLKEVNSQSLQSSLKNLDVAFTNFFDNGTGYPKFKNRNSRQTFACPQNVYVDFKKGTLDIPKFDDIKVELHRPFKGEIRSCTVSRTTTGKYFVSILVENNCALPEKKQITESTAIGIDLGLKHFLIGSNGVKKDNPQHLRRAQKILAWKQRKLSRKTFGSNRRKIARLRVAKQHEKIANQRKDFLHNLSNEITNRFDSVCMEKLKVRNMVRNHKLALSISDAGWGEFVRQVQYKCEHKGKNFSQIDTFAPSSKTCSCCEFVNVKLKLSDREWVCEGCGVVHDRDENAAQNIKRWGLEKLWRMERSHQDIEVLPLPKTRKRVYRKQAVEMSKVQNTDLLLAS